MDSPQYAIASKTTLLMFPAELTGPICSRR